MPELSHEGRFHEDGLRVTLQRFKATKKRVLKEPLNFQVAPLEAFAWTQSAAFQDFDTLSRGQFSRRGARALLTFDIRTVVVDYQPSWASYERARPNAPHPQKIAQLLKTLVQVGTPMMFVARSGWWEGNDLRLPVTLRSMSSEERAGEIDARYFDLSFVEWREQELDQKGLGGKRDRHALPTTIEIFEDGSMKEVSEGNGQGNKIPTKAKDPGTAGSLQDLAQYFYGDPTLWRAIVLENGISDFAPSRNLAELNRHGRRVRKLTIPRLVDPRTGGVEAPGG